MEAPDCSRQVEQWVVKMVRNPAFNSQTPHQPSGRFRGRSQCVTYRVLTCTNLQPIFLVLEKIPSSSYVAANLPANWLIVFESQRTAYCAVTAACKSHLDMAQVALFVWKKTVFFITWIVPTGSALPKARLREVFIADGRLPSGKHCVGSSVLEVLAEFLLNTQILYIFEWILDGWSRAVCYMCRTKSIIKRKSGQTSLQWVSRVTILLLCLWDVEYFLILIADSKWVVCPCAVTCSNQVGCLQCIAISVCIRNCGVHGWVDAFNQVAPWGW